MALQKQNVDISFAQGLETKVDPFRVPVGKFLSLENTIFSKAGLLQKRNGYKELTALFNNSYKYTTTFSGGLTAIGSSMAAYSAASNSWVQKGSIQPVSIDVLKLVRNSTNQASPDIAFDENGNVFDDLGLPAEIGNIPRTDIVFKLLVGGGHAVFVGIQIGVGHGDMLNNVLSKSYRRFSGNSFVKLSGWHPDRHEPQQPFP